jgi:hypothetical protein
LFCDILKDRVPLKTKEGNGIDREEEIPNAALIYK